jgi:hypothetical protein
MSVFFTAFSPGGICPIKCYFNLPRPIIVNHTKPDVKAPKPETATRMLPELGAVCHSVKFGSATTK